LFYKSAVIPACLIPEKWRLSEMRWAHGTQHRPAEGNKWSDRPSERLAAAVCL